MRSDDLLLHQQHVLQTLLAGRARLLVVANTIGEVVCFQHKLVWLHSAAWFVHWASGGLATQVCA